MRSLLVPLSVLAVACGASAPSPRTAPTGPDAQGQAQASTAAPAPERTCWNLQRGQAWAELCVERARAGGQGGRVHMSGPHPLDAPYARTRQDGAAGTVYEELLDAQGRRVLLLVRCGPCGCGGCLREVRVGRDPESAAWTNPACPSVTFEGCPGE